jgi:hypothetical protein
MSGFESNVVRSGIPGQVVLRLTNSGNDKRAETYLVVSKVVLSRLVARSAATRSMSPHNDREGEAETEKSASPRDDRETLARGAQFESKTVCMLEQWQCSQHRMRTVRLHIYAAHLTVYRGLMEQLEQLEIDAFPTAFVTDSESAPTAAVTRQLWSG